MEDREKAGAVWKNGHWCPDERAAVSTAWEEMRQYPRRVVDEREAAQERVIRILTPEERDARDSVDPCPDCICTRFMGEDYCDRPCRAYIRHYDYVRRQAAGRLRDGRR